MAGPFVLSEYERKRLSNIKENSQLLNNLGIDTVKRRKPVIPSFNASRRSSRNSVKRKVLYFSDSSSDSEEEWLPGMEEDEYRKVPTFRERMPPQVCTSNFNFYQSNNGCQQSLLGGSKKQKYQTEEDSNLPDWLKQDDDGSQDFYGYTIFEDDVIDGMKLSDAWTAAFGIHNVTENDFEGFEIDHIISCGPPQLSSSRYSLRKNNQAPHTNSKTISMVDELSNEDHYLFCEDCGDLHYGDCPTHGPLKLLDPAFTGFNEPSKEYTDTPVPDCLTVKPSLIPGAGLGVFAVKDIPSRVQFGPYQGEYIMKSELTDSSDTSYMWEVKIGESEPYFIDGKSSQSSNWLKFVNCARTEDEQNLVAFQYYGHIFYRTFKPVTAGEELFVWYGEQYARDLGISTNSSPDFFYCCKQCGADFAEKSLFTAHLRRSKICFTANPQPFICLKCKERFSELHQLQHHIRRHEFNRCNKNTNMAVEKKKDCIREDSSCRAKEHHLKDKERLRDQKRFKDCRATDTFKRSKPYKCNYCDYSSARKDNLSQHIRIHTGEKPYKCNYCDYSCGRKGVLSLHIRTHTGEKPYKCNYCDYSCGQKSALSQHIRTHTGEKPYKCNYCDYSCGRKGTLSCHIRTHTGEKPYKCNYCDYSCGQKSALSQHIRTHTGEKPYKCNYCDYSCAYKGTLSQHLRTHHIL